MITVGSLFSGIGGFDLGLERAGMKIRWQVEIDPVCTRVLSKRFPDATRYGDVKDFVKEDFDAVELVCGGDPCPIRSKARSIWRTKHPDLSGYFLAVVGGSKPRWVVRENVPASDDTDFCTALEYLGYQTVIISTNAASVTAQNRERDFIVACNREEEFGRFVELPLFKNGPRYAETKHQAVQAYPVLTTHACRWDARDGYIWDGYGLRVANSQERCTLAGFDRDWLGGLSKTSVARMTGNAVVPQIVELIGRAIVEASHAKP